MFSFVFQIRSCCHCCKVTLARGQADTSGWLSCRKNITNLFKGFTQIRGLARSCGPFRRRRESSVWDKNRKALCDGTRSVLGPLAFLFVSIRRGSSSSSSPGSGDSQEAVWTATRDVLLSPSSAIDFLSGAEGEALASAESASAAAAA